MSGQEAQSAPAVVAILGQLGIAAIFVVAWFRSENKRDQERKLAEERYDKLRIEYNAAQTAHRTELIQMLQNIVLRIRQGDA